MDAQPAREEIVRPHARHGAEWLPLARAYDEALPRPAVSLGPL